ncbi:MAG: extracellular solute-binding protein, partial [Planctomycetaceae bacterium]
LISPDFYRPTHVLHMILPMPKHSKSGGRRRVAAIVCLVSLALGVGCSDSTPRATSQLQTDPQSDVTIEVAVPAGMGFSDSWQLVLDEWSAQTGTKVKLREYDAGAYESPLIELLADNETRKRLPTMFVIPMSRAAELAAVGAVAVIPHEQQGAERLNWTDVFQGLRGSATYVGRSDFFVPVSSPVLVCYYRRDLLERAGLNPPSTWDDYQTLLETLGRWAPGLTAVEPWSEEYRATLFLARAAAFAKHPANISFCFDIKNGEPLIENPGFVRALESSRAAFSKMPAAVAHYQPADCRRDLLAGKAAIGIALETGPGNPPLPFGTEKRRSSSTTGEQSADAARNQNERDPVDLACVRLPGSKQVFNTSLNEWESPRSGVNFSSLNGFAGLVIGVSTRGTRPEKLAAWNLLGTVTLGNLEAAFPGPTKSVCRESQVPDGPRWLGDELGPDTAQSYINAVEKTLQDAGLTAELPVIGRWDFRNALTDELGAFLASGSTATPQGVLAKVAQRWRDILKELGPANVHNSYLRGLGFPGPMTEESDEG